MKIEKKDTVFYKCIPIIDHRGEIHNPVTKLIPLSEMADYCEAMRKAGVIYTVERYENREESN